MDYNTQIDVSALLTEALSENQERRQLAETNIEGLAAGNLGIFLTNLSKILSDESNPKGVRQLSATLIKNTILFTDKYKGQWEMLDQEIKQSVKQNVLSTLASGDKDIRKAAGLAIASICKLELPLGQWQEIISTLCQTSSNENKFIQLASITTLGYISQEVSVKDLNESQQGEILSCFYEILSKNEDLEVQQVTIAAMLNFIPYMKRFFENKEQRTLILSVIFKSTNSSDLKIRASSIQCILEIGRLYYDYIEENLSDFLSVTKLHMLSDDESIAILAYEFWCSIGDIEIARLDAKKTHYPCRNYCNQSYSELLSVITQHLLTVNSVTEESWNLSKAASCLLSILSQCCEYNLIQEVINFITKNMSQHTQLAKEASILSFGAILETRHKEKMADLVISSVDNLLTFLNDKETSSSLKETTSWVIEKIAEIYGEEFEKHIELFDRLLENLLLFLTQSKRKVICHICNSLHYFAHAFKPAEGQNSNILSKHMKNILETLLKLAYTKGSYDQDDNVSMSCFYAIGSLIENSAPDTRIYIQSFFGNLIEAFKSTLDAKVFENDTMRFDYQAYIATSIEPCLISGYIDLTFDDAKEILYLIILTFKERRTVYEEGLMAASSVGLAIGAGFNALVPEFGPYLIHALNSVNETSLCKTAIHSTSDLIRSIGPAFRNYLDQIIPLIIGILSNTEADKSLKPHSFNVLTDVFVVCREGAFKYFNDVMELICSALEAATFLTDDIEDFENIEYFDSLREHILECVTCIFHTVKDLKREDDFKRYVVGIVAFINTINQKEYSPSIVRNKLKNSYNNYMHIHVLGVD